AARLLARGTRGDQAADGRPGQRARVVAEGQATGVELLLERVPVDARFAAADEVGLVDLEDAVESGHVDRDLACLGRHSAADPCCPTHRRDGYIVRGGPAQD